MESKELKLIINRLINNSSLAENFLKIAKNEGEIPDVVGKSISALSNRAVLENQMYGWLLIESGRATDEISINSLLSSLKNEIPEYIEREVQGAVEVKETLYTVVRIGAALQGNPTGFKGHFYGLINNSVAPLELGEFDKIKYFRPGNEWPAQICQNATIKNLDQTAIKKAKTGFKSRHMHLEKEIDTWSDIDFLRKTGLAKGEQLTNAAIILLGNEESENLDGFSNFGLTWIMKDQKGAEKGFQHFGFPFILQIDAVLNKISNLKYDYSEDTSFKSVETTKYEAAILREIITNAIVHQDYNLTGKINIIEEPERLIISNKGSFMAGNEDIVVENDAPNSTYQNPFLCKVMEKLNLLDLIGGGIRKMMIAQKKRNFPMPDFELSFPNEIKVILHGKILNKNYTEKLVANPGLSLSEVRGLDKVQKRKIISEEMYQLLRTKKLVSGRYPDIMVASKYSAKEGEKPVFVQKRVLSTSELKDLVTEHLKKVKEASRGEIDKLLIDKYPDELPHDKRRNKIKNLLYQMSRVDGKIENAGSATKPIWKLV